MTAKALRELHVPGKPLVLPNAWDADTARLVVDAGFPVVATSSAAVAAVLGYADGEEATAGEMFAAAARISAVIDVPMTVDAESGYGLPATALVDLLFEADAVGCNIEDTDQQSGQRRSGSEQAALLAAMRERAGDGLVINARIDSFLSDQTDRDALPDALARAQSYLDAGADCLYPIHVKDPDVLGEFVIAVAPAPVNATYLPGGPSLATMAELGVARVSLGAGLWRASQHWLKGTLRDLAAGTPPY